MTQLAEKIHGYALEDLSLGGKPFNTLMERLKSEKSLSWLQCSFYPFKNKKKRCFRVITTKLVVKDAKEWDKMDSTNIVQEEAMDKFIDMSLTKLGYFTQSEYKQILLQ